MAFTGLKLECKNNCSPFNKNKQTLHGTEITCITSNQIQTGAVYTGNSLVVAISLQWIEVSIFDATPATLFACLIYIYKYFEYHM